MSLLHTPGANAIAAMDRLMTAAVDFVEQYPERATRELRAAVAAFKLSTEDPATAERATCKRCGHGVVKMYDT